MLNPLNFKADLPVFLVIGLFHLSDILFTLAGGYYEILWLVLLASFVHWILLGWIYFSGQKVVVKVPIRELAYEP